MGKMTKQEKKLRLAPRPTAKHATGFGGEKMNWWQIILVLLIGVFPCICVAAFAGFCLFEMRTRANLDGEIIANVRGIQRIVQRIDKKLGTDKL